MFVKCCEPDSVPGGKVLCLLSAVNLTVFRVGKVCEELSEAETD